MSTPREHTASGQEALALTVKLLQRVRLAHPEAGLWEAADVQWWWRRPCQSDEVERIFWLDERGPVAATMLTSWSGDTSWQCDPLLVPGVAAPTLETVWRRALELADRHATGVIEVPVDDADTASIGLAVAAGLTAGSRDSTAWLDGRTRPPRTALPAGFQLVDRAEHREGPHPLVGRNGQAVEDRLQQCSLYDQRLDLAILDAQGRVAGYSLYWSDPVTKVGLVEPVRVEEEFQRKGLARAMLCEGINRLFESGATRAKVSYSSAAAGALYFSVGFRERSSTTWYRSAAPRAAT